MCIDTAMDVMPCMLPPLPPVEDVDSWMVRTILNTPISNGLAILIGCTNSCKPDQKPLEGVKTDLKTLWRTFAEQLLFTTLCLNDPSREVVKKVLKHTSELNKNAIMLPKTWKRIVITFSGHGDKEHLFTKDGQIHLREDMVNPLQAIEAEELALIPKLFFVDACRGSGIDRGVPVVDVSWFTNMDQGPVARGGGSRVPSRGNCHLAYSTLLGMKSFEDERGGFWMQILLEELTDPQNIDVIIEGIMTKVRKRLISRCGGERVPHYQQPVCESTLWDEVKLLKEAYALAQAVPQGLQQSEQQQEVVGYGNNWPEQQQQHQYPWQPSQQPSRQQTQYLQPQQQGMWQPHQQQQIGHSQYQQGSHQQQGSEQQQAPYHYQQQGGYQLQHAQQQHQLWGTDSMASLPGAYSAFDGAASLLPQGPEGRGPPGNVEREASAQGEIGGGNDLHSHKDCVLRKKTRKAASCKKAKLEGYFESRGEDNAQIVYETKPDGSGYRCTVFCPEVGYAEGETKPTEDRAEQNAAKKALELLTP